MGQRVIGKCVDFTLWVVIFIVMQIEFLGMVLRSFKPFMRSESGGFEFRKVFRELDAVSSVLNGAFKEEKKK